MNRRAIAESVLAGLDALDRATEAAAFDPASLSAELASVAGALREIASHVASVDTNAPISAVVLALSAVEACVESPSAPAPVARVETAKRHESNAYECVESIRREVCELMFTAREAGDYIASNAPGVDAEYARELRFRLFGHVTEIGAFANMVEGSIHDARDARRGSR